MARYLRSTDTGVVLPYNPKLAQRVNVAELTPQQAQEYEAAVRAGGPIPRFTAPQFEEVQLQVEPALPPEPPPAPSPETEDVVIKAEGVVENPEPEPVPEPVGGRESGSFCTDEGRGVS